METNPLRPARTLYPPVEPYETGMLDVGDGQQLYWEVSGNPDGKPAVFLHGGPGGGTAPQQRQFFDPKKYRIVLVDQRGCGKSTPHASTPGIDMSANTTGHLVGDIEKLREHLGVEEWLVFGGSWGSALALAYAEMHPDHVSELVLRGIFTLRRPELDWFYNEGASFIAPERWESYLEPLRDSDGTVYEGDFIQRYNEILFGDDLEAARRASVAWTTWEGTTTTLIQDEDNASHYAEPDFALAFARIENHYFVNGGFFEVEDQLLRDAPRLANIPGTIVHGRYDVVCPPQNAWDLHQAWPKATLEITSSSGHSAFEAENVDALVRATDAYA